jgi:hypothetical protein
VHPVRADARLKQGIAHVLTNAIDAASETVKAKTGEAMRAGGVALTAAELEYCGRNNQRHAFVTSDAHDVVARCW